MQTALIILVAIAMLATLGVLFAGVAGFARGNDPARSNVLMRWRVLLQFGAILLFMLLVWLARG
jgi:ABC-type dipeptide/oligopeptide/nickel transport system permease subunit